MGRLAKRHAMLSFKSFYCSCVCAICFYFYFGCYQKPEMNKRNVCRCQRLSRHNTSKTSNDGSAYKMSVAPASKMINEDVEEGD